MKKYLMLAVVSLFMFQVATKAQDAPERKARGERKEMSPAKNLEKIATELNLTPDQKANLKALFEKQASEAEKLKAEGPEAKEKMKELRKTHGSELKTLLGDEKYEKLKTIMQGKKDKPKAE